MKSGTYLPWEFLRPLPADQLTGEQGPEVETAEPPATRATCRQPWAIPQS